RSSDLFDQTIASFVALAALLPVIAALGGNAGMQALTVTVRRLALGEIEYSNAKNALRREAKIVLFNGTAIAAVAGLVVYVWFGDSMLSAIVVAAVFLNLLVAGVAGTLIPLGLHRVGIDPAVASSIFLTTTTDIFGFFIFLLLAEMFLL
ncbi:MAG TPA: magnesium transporter, partial [Epsilonproteobacteria bacterium]|nr:magnesium transporter [Campylobacterota bacterium]